MRTRYKILLTIILAVLWFFIGQASSRTTSRCQPFVYDQRELDMQYDQYNDRFFDGKLPQDVVLDFGETDPLMAGTTDILPDGRFHIAFNEKFCQAHRFRNLVLQHEMCHIKTYEDTKHGKIGRACMLQLDMNDAFREELIDNYHTN